MSRFFANQKDILKGIQKAFPVTDNSIETFNAFQLRLTENNLYIASTDGEITFIGSIPVKVDSIDTTQIAVNSDYLSNIIKNLPDNSEVLFFMSEDGLIISTDTFETRLSSFEGDLAEIYTDVFEYTTEEYDDEFNREVIISSLEGLIPIAQNYDGLDLPSIIINENNIYSTDNYILSTVSINHNKPYIFSVKVAQCILSILKNTNAQSVYTKYIQDDSMILVRIGEDIFYFLNQNIDIDSSMLEYILSEIENYQSSILLFSKSETHKLMNRISAGKLSKNIQIEITPQEQRPDGYYIAEVIFKSENDIIKSKEKILAISKNPIQKKFSIDFEQFIKVIRLVKTDKLKFYYFDDTERVYIKSYDNQYTAFMATTND